MMVKYPFEVKYSSRISRIKFQCEKSALKRKKDNHVDHMSHCVEIFKTNYCLMQRSGFHLILNIQ